MSASRKAKGSYNSYTDCKYFSLGTCGKGMQCKFRHCEESLTSQILCIKWLDRKCFDKKCPQRHSRSSQPVAQTQQNKDEEKYSPAVYSERRESEPDNRSGVNNKMVILDGIDPSCNRFLIEKFCKIVLEAETTFVILQHNNEAALVGFKDSHDLENLKKRIEEISEKCIISNKKLQLKCVRYCTKVILSNIPLDTRKDEIVNLLKENDIETNDDADLEFQTGEKYALVELKSLKFCFMISKRKLFLKGQRIKVARYNAGFQTAELLEFERSKQTLRHRTMSTEAMLATAISSQDITDRDEDDDDAEVNDDDDDDCESVFSACSFVQQTESKQPININKKIIIIDGFNPCCDRTSIKQFCKDVLEEETTFFTFQHDKKAALVGLKDAQNVHELTGRMQRNAEKCSAYCKNLQLKFVRYCTKIILSNIPLDTRKDEIVNLLKENKIETNDDADFEFQTGEKYALVELKSLKFCFMIWKMKLLLKGQRIQVFRYNDGFQTAEVLEFEKHRKGPKVNDTGDEAIETEIDETQRTIEIHGNIENIDEDLLILFLEHPAKSGGGEIEKADLLASPPWVTFRHKESADRVLSRSDLALGRVKLIAKRYKKKQSKQNEIIIRNIDAKITTEDSVMCYIENITRLEVKEAVFSHDQKSVRATFSNKIDWKVLKERHQKKSSLDGSKTEIMEVPVCTTLLISNIAAKTTLDGLELTLEKPNLAGFDSVEDVAYEKGAGYAIVQFSNRIVAEKVLRNAVFLDGAELKIDEFIPEFQTAHTWKILNKAPDEIRIEIDPEEEVILDFILSKQSTEVCKLLKSEVYKTCERFEENNKERIRVFTCFTPDRKISDPRKLFEQFYSKFFSAFVDFDLAEEDDKAVNEIMKQPSCCVVERLAKGVRITGERESVEKTRLEMENIIKERFEEKKKREAIVERRFPLPPGRAELLSLTGYFDELEKDFKVKVERSNNDLILSGEESTIRDIEHKVMLKLMFATDRTLQRSQGLCRNLSDQTRRTNAISKINSINTKIVFSADCQSKEIKFSAFTEDCLRRGIQIFDENYGDVHMQASSEQGSLLSNIKGSIFFANLKDSMNVTMATTLDELNIEVSGELQMCNMAKAKILDFLQENSFSTKTFGTSVGRSLAILKLNCLEIGIIELAGKEESVKIKENSNSSGILVSGLGDAVNAALEDLEELARLILSEEILLEKPGVRKLLQVANIKDAVRSIESEENVIIIEKSKDSTSSFTDEEVEKGISQSKPTTASNLICMFRTDEGLALSVFHDNITCHVVDAIVNPANNNLWLGGGVAGAISSAGGEIIQRECREYVRMHGEVDDGKAVVTNGGALPCKKVIHAVGPRWPSGMRHIGEGELQRIKNRCEEKLVEAMTEILILSEKEELTTVAVPAISSGVFGFPKDLCAKILVKTALQFSESNPMKAIREIHFVNNDHETVEVFRKEFDRMFGNSINYTKAKPEAAVQPASNSYDANSRTTTPEVRIIAKVPEEERKSRQTSNREIPPSEIVIEIVVGDLAQQQVDVIVNSASRDLDLSSNPCARALNNAAGSTLQDECKKHAERWGRLPNWGFAVTRGGSLKCDYVIHAICGQYDGVADGQAEKGLKKMVQNILEDAASRKAQSIAFPALGTGTLNFPHQKVAQILKMCVEEFGRERKSRGTLNEVKFVAYHADQLTIVAFNEVFKSTNATSKPPASGASIKVPKRKVVEVSKFEFTPLNLVIYSTSQSRITKARGRLERIVGENIKSTETQIEQFKKLSDSQTSRIRREAQKKDVMFTVDEKTGKVTLTGYHEDTISMLTRCHEMGSELMQEDKENNLKDYIQWFVVQKDGTRISYDAKLNYKIEQHYKEKDESLEIEMINEDKEKCSYEINFKDLTVKDVENGEILKIERKELSRGSSFSLPSRWDPMPKLASGLEQSYHSVELANNSQEFQDVKKIFESSSGGTITNYHKIKRIQNPGLYQAYQAKKASMEKTSYHGSNEKSLFHGTDPNTCDQISHFGFNRSFAGRNATVYGEGVYFATTARYSRNYSSQRDSQGYRHMFLAKVLVGQYAPGQGGMKVPPPGYDTVTDSTGSPNMFVAFNDNQVYPEYLLLFS